MSGTVERSRHNTADGLPFAPASAPKSPWVTVFLIAVIVAALLPLVFYVYYGTVRQALTFVVEPGALSVHFGVGKIEIPWDDIADVAYEEEPARMLRQAGAGMTGLQMGWYRLEGFGRVYRLTTSAGPVVYVDTHADARSARPETRYVFSPEEPERFVELLQSMRTQAAGASGGGNVVFRSAPSASVFTDPIMIVALAVTLPLLFVVIYVVRKGAVGLRYAVGRDGIVVYHLGRKVYRWDSVRTVRRVDEPLPRMWRVIGASLPGYYAGDFAAGELGSLKVYATRLKPPVVLLDTRRGKVLISPADVDGFLAAVKEHKKDGR